MESTLMAGYLEDNLTKRIFSHLRLPQQIRSQIQITPIRKMGLTTMKWLKDIEEMKQQMWYKALRNTLMVILMRARGQEKAWKRTPHIHYHGQISLQCSSKRNSYRTK